MKALRLAFFAFSCAAAASAAWLSWEIALGHPQWFSTSARAVAVMEREVASRLSGPTAVDAVRCQRCFTLPVPDIRSAGLGAYRTSQARSWAAADRLTAALRPTATSSGVLFPHPVSEGGFVSDNNFLRLADYLSTHPEIAGHRGSLIGAAYAAGRANFFVFEGGEPVWSTFSPGPLPAVRFSKEVRDDSGSCAKWEPRESDWSLLSGEYGCVRRGSAVRRQEYVLVAASGSARFVVRSSGFPSAAAEVELFAGAARFALAPGATETGGIFPDGIAAGFSASGSTPEAIFRDLSDLVSAGASPYVVRRLYELAFGALSPALQKIAAGPGAPGEGSDRASSDADKKAFSAWFRDRADRFAKAAGGSVPFPAPFAFSISGVTPSGVFAILR